MTPFQATLYFLNNEREIDALERAFLNIIDQLELYENQHKNTIRSYVKNWQEEIDKLNKRYEKIEKEAREKYQEVLGTENPEDQDNIAYATHASGIDYLAHRKSEDVESVETKYLDYLDLFSKSTLIALYSLNENFLNKICEIASELFNQKIRVSHFNSRDYLNSSITYLELVIDVPKDSLEKYVSKLKDIQAIRNKIIHAGSQITDQSILNLVQKHSNSLNYDEEKQFLRFTKVDFNNDFFQLLKNFYEELFWLLEERQNNINLKNIFKNWFGLVGGEMKVTKIKTNKRSEKTRTIDVKLESVNKELKPFNTRLTLIKGKGYEREIIDQTDSKLIKELLKVEGDAIHLMMGLKPFITFNSNIDVRLFIY